MPFIIMSAPMKAHNGTDKRRRLAVVEIATYEQIPSRIDWRAAGVVQIVQTWEDLYCGRSRSCGFQKAMDEAEKLVQQLTVERAIALKRLQLAKSVAA